MDSDSKALEDTFLRRVDRSPQPLTAPITTDKLGTSLKYYALVDGRVYTSSSVRTLCRLLERVTLNDLALAELLAFGLVLRDETLFQEIRSIPAHTTLQPDGTLITGEGPRSSSRVADADTAATRLREILQAVIAELEPRWSVHCVGFTGGKDSRILAGASGLAMGKAIAQALDNLPWGAVAQGR